MDNKRNNMLKKIEDLLEKVKEKVNKNLIKLKIIYFNWIENKFMYWLNGNWNWIFWEWN